MMTIEQQHITPPARPVAGSKYSPKVEVREERTVRNEYLDLTRLAREVTTDMAALTRSHPISFEGDGACPIRGDRAALRSLVRGLLSNALNSSAPGREVRISVWRRGADIWLSAEDQGQGVAASLTERSFRPFLRLDSETGITAQNRAYLTPVKHIVEAHGAEIFLQGDGDHGTTVEIRFKTRFNGE